MEYSQISASDIKGADQGYRNLSEVILPLERVSQSCIIIPL